MALTPARIALIRSLEELLSTLHYLIDSAISRDKKEDVTDLNEQAMKLEKLITELRGH
jgi:hypothetical protein